MQVNTFHKRFVKSEVVRHKHRSLSPEYRQGKKTQKLINTANIKYDAIEQDGMIDGSMNKPARKAVKAYCADGILATPLFGYLVAIGDWQKVTKYENADFVYFSRENNIKWDTETGVMLNKVPGLGFLSKKKEQAYIMQRFEDVYGPGENPYYLETFRMSDDHQKYLATHKVAAFNV